MLRILCGKSGAVENWAVGMSERERTVCFLFLLPFNLATCVFHLTACIIMACFRLSLFRELYRSAARNMAHVAIPGTQHCGWFPFYGFCVEKGVGPVW